MESSVNPPTSDELRAKVERVREVCDGFPVTQRGFDLLVTNGPRPLMAAVRNLRAILDEEPKETK